VRCLAGAPMLRGGEVTAAQVLCAAERGEAAARVAARVVGWMGCRGATGRFKRATARGSSACGSAGKVAEISGGRCGWPSARARRGGDEAGRRARGAVRERGRRGLRAQSRPGWSGELPGPRKGERGSWA
jgi:hypothetical protein